MKTSLAPGSKVVTDYLREAGLLRRPRGARASTSSATAARPASATPGRCRRRSRRRSPKGDLVAASVLSGNRNFEGRINPEVRANYLASPPLVVAYALAGRIDIDLATRAARHRHATASRSSCATSGRRQAEIEEAHAHARCAPRCSAASTRDVFTGDEAWRALAVPEGDTFAWEPDSTYVRQPPYFDGMPAAPAPVARHRRRALPRAARRLGHDRPHLARRLDQDGEPGRPLPRVEHGVAPLDFNSYGSRRGNHEVMVRGTFANVRLRNRLAPELEGGFTRAPALARRRCRSTTRPMRYAAGGRAARRPRRQGVRHRLVARLGGEGPALLGVRAVIAESYERIHRSNLIGMGILPLEFPAGRERRRASASPATRPSPSTAWPRAWRAASPHGRDGDGRAPTAPTAAASRFRARVRIDTPQEVEYYRHGGILQYVLRQLLAERPASRSASDRPAPAS